MLKKMFFVIFAVFRVKFRFFKNSVKRAKKGCFWPKKGRF